MTAGEKFATAAAAAAFAAAAVGLYLIGSPSEQRSLRIDEQRVQHLQTLAAAISRYRYDFGDFPEGFDVLVEGNRLRDLPSDPVTGERYEYEILADTRYRLCAEFDRALPEERTDRDFWWHPAGRQCFDVTDPRFDARSLPPPR
jgi:hypothetical protein